MRGPRQPAVLRVEDDRVMPHRPAMRRVREMHAGEGGERRRPGQLPDVAAVGWNGEYGLRADCDDV